MRYTPYRYQRTLQRIRWDPMVNVRQFLNPSKAAAMSHSICWEAEDNARVPQNFRTRELWHMALIVKSDLTTLCQAIPKAVLHWVWNRSINAIYRMNQSAYLWVSSTNPRSSSEDGNMHEMAFIPSSSPISHVESIVYQGPHQTDDSR